MPLASPKLDGAPFGEPTAEVRPGSWGGTAKASGRPPPDCAHALQESPSQSKQSAPRVPTALQTLHG